MSESERESEDLRPVPGGKPGVYWSAMRVALVIVVLGVIAIVVWRLSAA